jgi:hypothetical protein
MVKCAECECTPTECVKEESFEREVYCANCRKEDACCCLAIHFMKAKDRRCCNVSSCGNVKVSFSDRNPRNKSIHKSLTGLESSKGQERDPGLYSFFLCAKGLYAAALGIEILCIAAAEIGENTGLYLFGFNAGGIVIAYVMGYALAGFTTFITILGRYGNAHQTKKGIGACEIDSCCSALEQDSTLGFVSNVKTTFVNFAVGFRRLSKIRNQQGLKMILKSSLFILITAESACILTAETVDLIFYQHSILLSVPLALLAGAFTVVAPAAYRKARQLNTNAKTAKFS